MNKILLLTFISLIVSYSSARSQQVCRWDVAEDTNFVFFESNINEVLSASSTSDIAQIANWVWDSSHSPRTVVRNSTDSGKTWKKLFKNTGWTDEWHSISHPTSNAYVITGDSLYPIVNNVYRHHAYLLLSSDAGTSWRYQYWDTNTVIYGLKMLNKDIGIAVLGHASNVDDSLPSLLPPELLVTQDGWKTWSTLALPDSMPGIEQLICFAPNVYGAITYKGYVKDQYYSEYWKTLDGGKTWKSIGLLPFVFEVTFVNENLAWGAGTDWNSEPSRSLIINTTDGGITWLTQLDTNVSVNHWSDGVSHISFADSLHGFAVGHQILETSDGGKTWNANKPPYEVFDHEGSGNGGGGGLKGIIMPSPNLAFMACGGPILRYTGKHRLAAPVFDEMPYRPVPIEPTKISWSPIQGASIYRIQLGVTTSSIGATLAAFDTIELDTTVLDPFFYFLPKPAQNYYARVQAIAEGMNSDWRWNADWDGLGVYFHTVHQVSTPLPPTIISPAYGSHSPTNDVKVVWTSVPGAINYHVTCRLEGMSIVDQKITSDTFATFSGLYFGTNYGMSVEALLSDDTTEPGSTWFSIDAALSSVHPTKSEEVSTFPNPSHDIIHVVLPVDGRSAQFELYDMLGHAQSVEAIRETSGVRIDVRSLPAGIYTLIMPGCKAQRIAILH